MSHQDIVFFIAQLSAFSEVNDTSDTCACSCKYVRKSLGLSHKLPDIGGLSSGNFNGPAADGSKWEKLEGDPHTVNLNAYTSEDGSKIMGTWICTPGKWYVEYVKWEYCDFREGYCIITPEGKEPIHLRAGDIFVIEPGMKGTWEVVETVRKYFVFA
jgi:uncharacterized cupin superfamily protein